MILRQLTTGQVREELSNPMGLNNHGAYTITQLWEEDERDGSGRDSGEDTSEDKYEKGWWWRWWRAMADVRDGDRNRTETEPKQKSHKYQLGIRMIYPIYPEPNGSYPKPNRIPRANGE